MRHPVLLSVALAVPLALSVAVPASAGAVADTAPPIVNVDQTMRFTTGDVLSDSGTSPTMQRRVTWKRYDASGICGQSGAVYKRVGNSWSYLVGVGASQTEVSFPAQVGGYYQLALSVTDCKGNAGTYNRSFYDGSLRQESAYALSPGWTTASCTCWSAGSAVKSTKRGATATMTTSARAMAVVADKAPDRGIADVYVNGVRKATIDMRGPKVNRAVIWTGFYATDATREVKVVVRSGRVDVDAFVSSSY